MKKKYTTALLLWAFAMLKSLAWVGNGTESSPYQIATPEDLVELSNSSGNNTYEGFYFLQTADINMQGITDFNPIGLFKGYFDGNDNHIYNLVIIKSGEDVALFSAVTDGVIKNVHIEGASRFEGKNNVAAIVGTLNNGTVNDCRSSALIIGNNEYSQEIGGIAGAAMMGSKIKESHNTGLIMVKGANSKNIGGIAGVVSNGSEIINCYNKGTVDGNDNTGGICGLLGSDESVRESYNLGVVNGNNYVGGITGYITTGLLSVGKTTVCYNAGQVTGNNYVGGIGGYSAHTGLCANIGSVGGTDNIGGITGSGYVYSSYNNGVITGDDAVGGIAGLISKIDGCYNTGHIRGGDGTVGGLGGAMMGTENEATNSYNVGVVSGGDYPGGLVGYVKTGGFINNNKIINCYWSTGFFPGQGVSNITNPPLNQTSGNFRYWGLTSAEMKGVFHTTLSAGFVFNGNDGFPLIEGIVLVPISVAPPVYTITANAGVNGTISLPETLSAAEGASLCFTIMPDEDMVIDKVMIDGVAVTPVNNSFNLQNVSDDHDIQVTFRHASSLPVYNPEQDLNLIFVSAGCIIGKAEGKIGIYTITGRLVNTFTANGDFQSKVLQPGMYIVKTNMGSQKVLVP